MPSTFANIVKSQRLDRQAPGRRRFDAQNIYTLADRARRGDLTAHKRQDRWFRKLLRFIARITRRPVV